MSLDSMQDLLLEELRDLYNAEQQLTRALPKLVETAASPTLRQAFQSHLQETEGHVSRLEQIFEGLNEKPTGKKCKAMEGLIDEGADMLAEKGSEAVRDAGIIAAAQRVEHYEIAAYGSAVSFAAGPPGHRDAAAADPGGGGGRRREAVAHRRAGGEQPRDGCAGIHRLATLMLAMAGGTGGHTPRAGESPTRLTVVSVGTLRVVTPKAGRSGIHALMNALKKRLTRHGINAGPPLEGENHAPRRRKQRDGR
jgi:ferritin-like metal-binding protein YciE